MSNFMEKYKLRIGDNICVTEKAARTFDNHVFFSVDRDRHGQYVTESKDGYAVPFPAHSIEFVRVDSAWWQVLETHFKEKKNRFTYDLIRCNPGVNAWLEDMFKKIY